MEDQTNFSDDLRRYMALAWHWAWLFVIAAALAGTAAYLLSSRETPIYEAVSTVLINEAPATVRTDYSSIVVSEQLAVTYSQLMTMEPVLIGVREELGLSQMPGSIEVAPFKDSQLITIQVQDTDPVRAADIANTLPLVFAEQNRVLQEQRFSASKENLKAQLDEINGQIDETVKAIAALGASQANQAERDVLETTLVQYRQTYAGILQSYEQVRLAEAQSISNISVIEQADIPRAPIRPQPLRTGALAAVVGLMAAAGLVFLIEALDDSLKSPEEITEKLGLPVLGLIPTHKVNGRPITAEQPRSPVSEAFRSLRTNLAYASIDTPLKTLMITSPSPEEGKSTISANLGIIMAQGGLLVAVVDADLRRPRIHQKLGLDNLSGMTDLFMLPEVVLNGEVQPTTVPNLVAITSGKLPPNPAELVGSEKMRSILEVVGKMVDIAILDTPPILAVTDAAALAPRTDGVIMVIKPGITKTGAARQAVDLLRRGGANILGVVLNDVNLKKSRYRYSYYKNYYSNYGKYYSESAK
jgi:non-specific protein-tyrosine kinase